MSTLPELTDAEYATHLEIEVDSLCGKIGELEALNKQLRGNLHEARLLVETMSDAITWSTSFYHDVENTTPEYFEHCGDVNATQHLYQQAQEIQECAKAFLASLA